MIKGPAAGTAGSRRRGARRGSLHRAALLTCCLAASSALAEEPLPAGNDAPTSAAIARLAGPDAWGEALAGPRLEGLDDPRPPPLRVVVVETAGDLRAAVGAAEPGTAIEIHPGSYDFSGTKIEVDRPGLPQRPIVLRAAKLGSVRLRFSLLEGFHVVAPYWTFENLVIEGTCRNDHDCEHAFHVVGDAVGVVIQNNWVADFNAAIKVNGKAGHYPDDGVIRYNAFVNSRPRQTNRPVTLLDIVSVSRWRVQKNLIADFAKAGGNHTSYGAFFKGAGEDNIFEQNLVRCEARHAGFDRIGFSFGDGGTGRRFCRDGGCRVEHRGGIARNNVIMQCPRRAGISLNKSAETLIHNNALIATGGIELRGAASDAMILNNIIDGRITASDGAVFTAMSNIMAPPDAQAVTSASSSVYVDARGGDLRLKDRLAILGRGVTVGGDSLDLCGQAYGEGPPDIGPLQSGPQNSCARRLW
jgi:hypothetical protein